MFRLLVVDDEPIEREAVRLLVERHLPDFHVVGEAGSGRQAIELAERHRPDIVLLDIQMPGLSGLAALRAIRDRVPDARCVIISAYDYFHFAQEALQLGAVDYLLKPVRRDRLVEALRRVGSDIAAARRQRELELASMERWDRLLPVLEARLAEALQRPDADPAELAVLQETLGLRFAAGFAVVARVHEGSVPPGTPDPAAALRQAHQILRQVAHSLCACAVGPLAGDSIAAFVDLEDAEDEYTTRVWAVEMARKLRDRVKEQTGVRFRLGVGRPYPGAHLLHRSYQEALTAADDATVSEKVNHYGDLFPQAPARTPAPRDGAPARDSAGSAAREAVERARLYIAAHFAEDLALEQVAREVALSPYYFSKVFKQVVGENFVDYVARVRVEEAKRRLADPNLTIKEISYAVGFNDPNYFTRVFRKLTGQSPSEYRAALGDGNGLTGTVSK